MGLTHFPHGVSSFGVPVMGGGNLIPQTTGDYFFVDDSGSNSNEGTDPDHPVATLDTAIGLCTADHGDVIILMPGHAESATAIAADVAGVTVVGLGSGEAMPTITGTTAAADLIDVTADSFVMKNVSLVGGASGTTALVDISADGDYAVFEGCRFTSGAAAPVDMITLATGADHLSFINCDFIGSGSELDNCILCEGYVAYMNIRGCYFDTTASAGVDEAIIQFAVCGSGPVWIDNCMFMTNTDNDSVFLAVSENDPAMLVSNCLSTGVDFTDVANQITYESMAWANNRWGQPGFYAPEGSGQIPSASTS